MHFSTPFLLFCLLSLTGCSESQLPQPQQSASLATENNEHSELSSASIDPPDDYGLKPNENAELEYRLRKKGVYPIPPEEGGGYGFDDTFETCPEEELPLLSQVKGLRSFWIGNDSFSPTGWKQIGQISGLETFLTRSSKITDEHLIGLQGLAHLRDLQIIRNWNGESPITDKGLQVLTGHPELRRLVLHSSDLNPRACELIGNCTQLRVLELRGPLTNECLKPLGKLKNLKYLILEGTFSDAGLEYLGDLKHLERLVIHSDQLTGSGLSYLANISGLRELGFSSSPETNPNLKSLDQLPALGTLSLAGPTINDALLLTMPDLPKLKALSLRRSNITDNGLDALVQVKNLTELDLISTQITNAGLKRLKILKQLQVLLLGDSPSPDLITGDGLAPLAELPNLEQLDINFVYTGNLDLRPLANVVSLMEINLSSDSAEAWESWKKVQAQRPNLKKVDFIPSVSRQVGELGIHLKEIP